MTQHRYRCGIRFKFIQNRELQDGCLVQGCLIATQVPEVAAYNASANDMVQLLHFFINSSNQSILDEDFIASMRKP